MNSISGAQVNTYTYDATGNARTESAALGTAINPTGATALSYTFDARNRLKQVQIGATATDTVTYKVNGLGQRYQKTGSGQFLYNSSATVNVTTGLSPQAESLAYNARYVYDEQGRLLGEYSPEGKLIQETIWLDDLPVATIRPKGSNIQTPQGLAGTGANAANNTGKNTSSNPVNVELYYLHPDHLGTPRVATRSAAVNGATSGPNAINKAVWRWDSDPFGTSLGTSKPNENPQNVTGTASKITAASFRVNNRFPGQIADAESGKYYNYLRDYDSVIGRYTESDPIGLKGGSSTFGYVKQQPLRWFDPTGLKVQRCCRSTAVTAYTIPHCWLKTDTITAGMNNSPLCSVAGGAGPNAGSGYPGQPVFVSDHGCDKPESCEDVWDVDEGCVNNELQIGAPLGNR